MAEVIRQDIVDRLNKSDEWKESAATTSARKSALLRAYDVVEDQLNGAQNSIKSEADGSSDCGISRDACSRDDPALHER